MHLVDQSTDNSYLYYIIGVLSLSIVAFTLIIARENKSAKEKWSS